MRSLLDHLIARRAELQRIVRFACVGGLGLLLNSAVLWALTEHAHLYYLASSVVATEVAIVSNFALNHAWTFASVRGGRSVGERLLKFNAVSVGGLVLTVLLLFVFKQVAGFPYLLANLLAIGCSSIWNYGANRRWTWHVATGGQA
jgi:dolichol-phosphate mannosyltransferase